MTVTPPKGFAGIGTKRHAAACERSICGISYVIRRCSILSRYGNCSMAMAGWLPAYSAQVMHRDPPHAAEPIAVEMAVPEIGDVTQQPLVRQRPLSI